MEQYPLRLPESIMLRVRKLARQDKASMNQFFITAIAEKISALETEDLLKSMAMRSDTQAFFNVMKKIPNIAPIDGDQI